MKKEMKKRSKITKDPKYRHFRYEGRRTSYYRAYCADCGSHLLLRPLSPSEPCPPGMESAMFDIEEDDDIMDNDFTVHIRVAPCPKCRDEQNEKIKKAEEILQAFGTLIDNIKVSNPLAANMTAINASDLKGMGTSGMNIMAGKIDPKLKTGFEDEEE